MAKKKAVKAKKAKKVAKAKAALPTLMFDLPDLSNLAVTQAHIDEGEPGEASSCPIALAVRDVLQDANLDFDEVSIAGGGDDTVEVRKVMDLAVLVPGSKTPHEQSFLVKAEVTLNYGDAGDTFISAFDESTECCECGARKQARPGPLTLKGTADVNITEVEPW